MKFGELIKAARLRLGITQEVLSKKMGRGMSYLSRIESKNEIPSPDIIKILAKELGYDGKTLLTIARDEKLAFHKNILDKRYQVED